MSPIEHELVTVARSTVQALRALTTRNAVGEADAYLDIADQAIANIMEFDANVREVPDPRRRGGR